jgi:outer membrane receptor protein involved in Fe transport
VQSGQVVPQAPWREWNQELKLTARRDWAAGGQNHPLQGGFEYRNERLSRGSLLPATPDNPFGLDEKDRDITVFWLQQEARLGRLTVSGGVRYDDYSDFGSQWSPKATALFAVAAGHGLRATFGQGFRPPYFNELYLNTPPFFVGNPDLQPESADTYSAGYAYAGRGAQVSADYFFNSVKNGIVFDLTRQPFTYGNLNRYESSGVNLSGAVTLPGGFTPSASYTYNTRQNERGDEIGGFPKHAAFLKLLWQEPRLGLRANLRTQINGQVPPGVTDTSYQDGYHVWYGHVSKALTVFGSTFELFAQLDNIFDERDLFRRQTCPPGAPAACVDGAPLNGANDLLQVWIAPRTFQVGVSVGTDWTR